MPKDTMEVTLGDRKFLVIDLTQPLRLDVEVYPGDPKPTRKIFSDIHETGWQHYTHEIGDHNFQPHGDGPNHQNKEAQDRGIDSFGIEYLFNKAILIDLSSLSEVQDFGGISYLVEVKKKDIEKYSKQLSQIGALIIRTGYDLWLEKNRPHNPKNLPYLNKEAANYLASFPNIKVVGIDSLTVDPVGSHDSHQALKEKFIVESLVHLHEIPSESRLNFNLQTTPLRIKGATGGPVIANAFIKI